MITKELPIQETTSLSDRVEKMLEAKKIFDQAKSKDVGIWWESVNPFEVWADDYQNTPWTELPEQAKHEVIGIYDSIPSRPKQNNSLC